MSFFLLFYAYKLNAYNFSLSLSLFSFLNIPHPRSHFLLCFSLHRREHFLSHLSLTPRPPLSKLYTTTRWRGGRQGLAASAVDGHRRCIWFHLPDNFATVPISHWLIPQWISIFKNKQTSSN
ncbi:hypothetical protein ACP275_08G105400 [Erythranthe tilingii]